ncbi:outer membrane protein [Sphingomonas azotifigens]|uniref:outer membrane protein n=1 Tax=Sphingomonas azotifigens TaxID=330920 RepID=UPI0009FE2339|nr:outer membrane beta-barrel protein [Sphingomonas azotifigens]
MNRVFAADSVRPECIVLGLLATIGGTIPAHAAPGQWYIAASVSGSALEKPHQTIANAPMPGSTLYVVNDIDFGWGGEGAVGYELRAFRIEAEIGYTSNHSTSYSAVRPISVTVPQDGKNRTIRYMANAYVAPFRGRWRVSPYIGGGIGAAHGHFTTFAAPARAPTAPPAQLLDVKDTRFAYQAMAGLSVPVARRLILSAQYRWLDSGTFHGVDSRGEQATRTLRGSNIDVGLRFTF